MSPSLRLRLRSSIFSPPMLASVGVGLFLLMWHPVFHWIIYNISVGPVSFQQMCQIFLDDIYRSFSLGGFSLFAPILAVLPATTMFCEDYNSGYLKSILCRVDRKRYIQETIICSGIAGGLAVFLPAFLCDLIYIIAGKPNTVENMGINYSTVFDETVYRNIQYLWGGLFLVLFLLVLAFLFGALWSNVGLCISALIPNRYIALAAPFALYFSLHLILYRLGTAVVFSPANMLMPVATFIPHAAYPLVYQMVLIIIVIGVTRKQLGRRLWDV